MRFFLPATASLISLLTPSAAEMVYSVKEAHISFDTGFNDDYSSEESTFIVNSVVTAYNEVHNPKITVMKKVKMESDSTDETSPGVVTHDMWAVLTLGMCSDCQPTDCDDDDGCGMLAATTSSNSTDLEATNNNHFNWQLSLCNKLQQGPFEVLNSAKHCKITYSQRAHALTSQHALSATAKSSTTQYEIVDEQIKIGITVYNEGPFTVAEENFLANCIMNGFNLVNDAAYSFADSIEIDSEGGLGDTESTTQEDSTNQLRGRVAMAPREFVVTTQMRFGRCRGCKACDPFDPNCERRRALEDFERDEFLNNLSAEAHPAWETAVCNLLRAGAFEVFSRAEDCIIERGTTLATLDQDDDEENSVVATDDDDDMVEETKHARIRVKIHVETEFSAAELAFIGNTAMIAYNEIHDASISTVGAVHLDQQQSDEVPPQVVVATGNSTVPILGGLTIHLNLFGWFRKYTCHMCAPDNCDSTFNRPWWCDRLVLGRTAFLESIDADSHGTWEESICSKLRNGPFDRLSQATECQVIFDSPTTESA